MNKKSYYPLLVIFSFFISSTSFSENIQINHMHEGSMMVHDEVNMPMLNGNDTKDYEVEELRQLFNNHSDIIRSVEILPNGIKTITETKN